MPAVAEPPPPPTVRPAPAPTPPAAPVPAAVSPEPGSVHRWTLAEFERMAKLGVLPEDYRVELLDGYLVDKEMPDPEHAAPIDELTEFFTLASAGRWRVRCQQDVRLPEQQSMPQPDLALVRRRPDGYRTQHPGSEDIFLLVEVANTSVAVDRGRKLALYARAGIAEYWIVNVPERVVEVFRDPQPDAGTYAHAETVRPGATLAPAAFPDAAFPVATLLAAEMTNDE